MWMWNRFLVEVHNIVLQWHLVWCGLCRTEAASDSSATEKDIRKGTGQAEIGEKKKEDNKRGGASTVVSVLCRHGGVGCSRQSHCSAQGPSGSAPLGCQQREKRSSVLLHSLLYFLSHSCIFCPSCSVLVLLAVSKQSSVLVMCNFWVRPCRK